MARRARGEGRRARILDAAGGSVHAITGFHVEEAAREGDNDATTVLAQYADNVALGLAALANVLDPEMIVIAGGLVELGSLLFEPLHASFMRHVEGAAYRPNIPIVPAELGERARSGRRRGAARELLLMSVRSGSRCRRSSRIPRSRSRSRRAPPRRPVSTRCSCSTTCGAATRRTAGPRWSASRCSARSPRRRRASASARWSRARRCGRPPRSPTAFSARNA